MKQNPQGVLAKRNTAARFMYLKKEARYIPLTHPTFNCCILLTD